ncbi:Fic family protein [Herbiconiux moechotypicola]|uniref:Fic family protein n=1 Tax=Herbiconiux moechotypicola TaxID=637393 RepID=UPI00217CF1EE|nr:Fic family protein [Herbiconiux moechotypicola]MCS5730157.1 Fic family protein [Herbiconiux moechotypicola]
MRTWRPRSVEHYSNAEVARQTGEYQSAVAPPIAAWSAHLSGALAAEVADATRFLIEFDFHAVAQLGKQNPALGPMSAILLRTESSSSSQIEQLTASAKQLALAELGEESRANAATVVGNVRAMEAALRLSADLDLVSILAMHRELLTRQPGLEREAGRLRGELVWIGNRDTAGPRGATFIAPQHELVQGALDDLVGFMRRDDLPVLVQIAVAHAQFETIHPFVDGNGRTGRALAQALLRGKGLATHTTVPLSAGLLTGTEQYFDALEQYRRGDAAPIIQRFCQASRYAAVTGRSLVDQLAQQLDASRGRLEGVRPQAAAWRILPVLIQQPVVNTSYLMNSLGLSAMTVGRALDTLVERGVVREGTGAARRRVWRHPGILDVLDTYAAEVRRAPRRR